MRAVGTNESNISKHRRHMRTEPVCAGVRAVHQPMGGGGGGEE